MHRSLSARLATLLLFTLPVLAGVRVENVVEGGPAAQAGIRSGDELVQIGDRPIHTLPDIRAALAAHTPGDTVVTTIRRGGEPVKLSVVLGDAGGSPRLGVMLGATPGASQDSGDHGRPIDAAERAELLRETARQLEEGYIYADKGQAFAQKLERAATDDKFREATTLGGFVGELNAYLREISNDKHLRVMAGRPGEGAGPRRVVRRAPGSGDAAGGTPRRVVRTAGGHDAGAHGADGQAGHAAPSGAKSETGQDDHGGAEPRRVVRRVPGDGGDAHAPGPSRRDGDGHPSSGDFGIREAKMLEGNVGYLNLAMFTDSPDAKDTVDAAMAKLAGADALIIDVGRNGGGAPWMVRYLSGFLFPEDTQLTETWMRGMDQPAERWTLGGQPTRAFADMPVYVLTSGRTFSAAESFTFGLKINDRITIVGERTGGGGHFGNTVSLNDELRLFVPRGRTYDPETGEGWEAEGITPDVAVPYEEALERARREATRG